MAGLFKQSHEIDKIVELESKKKDIEDILNWNTSKLLTYLENEHGIESKKIQEKFIFHEIDGESFLLLEEKDLINELKIQQLGLRKKLCKIINFCVNNKKGNSLM